jgi:hypothetical protein
VTSRWEPARVGLATLEQALVGAADQINNALAMVLLNVQFVDDLVDALTENGSGADAGKVIGDIVSGVLRIRDVVRDLGTVAGMSSAPGEVDVGGVAVALVRLIGGEAARVALIDRSAADSRCVAPRHVVVAALALCLGELSDSGLEETAAIELQVDGDGSHVVVRFRGRRTRHHDRFATARQLVRDAGGELIIAETDGTCDVELRLPRRGPRASDGDASGDVALGE